MAFDFAGCALPWREAKCPSHLRNDYVPAEEGDLRQEGRGTLEICKKARRGKYAVKRKNGQSSQNAERRDQPDEKHREQIQSGTEDVASRRRRSVAHRS
jgi:hypothetical protein